MSTDTANPTRSPRGRSMVRQGSVARSTTTGRFLSGSRGTTRRSSDLSKKSAEVFAEAELDPVLVTRRDAEPMVLMAARRADELDHLLESAAALTAVLLRDHPAPIEVMTITYPWMMALSAEDRAACAAELRDALVASFSTGRARRMEEAVASWQGTAEAVAAGLGSEPVELLEEQPLVGRP